MRVEVFDSLANNFCPGRNALRAEGGVHCPSGGKTTVRVGLDIGSTTIKCVVLDENDALVYSTYERHYSHILEKAQELLRRIDDRAAARAEGPAQPSPARQAWAWPTAAGVPFVQEVFCHPCGGQAVRPPARTASSSWAARMQRSCS